MFAFHLSNRNKKINRKFYTPNRLAKDLILVKKTGSKKKVMEKFGYIDPLTNRSTLNMFRLANLFSRYPGATISTKFGKF